jgi:hypothetical protein
MLGRSLNKVYMNKREEFDNGLYSIRFVGDELTHRGVSIYDLSYSLLLTVAWVRSCLLS